MKRKLTAGSTSISIPIFIQNSTTGLGYTGLTSATAGLVCRYRRAGSASTVTVGLVTMTLGTWVSGGFIADTTGSSGVYEFGIPNAALASVTQGWVIIQFYGVADMVPVLIEIEIDAINYLDGVRAGLTALPNAAAAASGGLPTSVGSGRVDLGSWIGVAPLALTSQKVQVETASIAANAISATSIASNAITAAKIAADAITSTQIGANAITAAKIATDAITSNQLATDAITSAQLAPSAVNEIVAGMDSSSTRLSAIETDTIDIQGRLPAALVSGRMNSSVGAVATGAITAAGIATDAIGSAQLATDAITSAQLATSAVSEIQSGLSTYAGGDTAGTTTLLSRISSGRALLLDNLDTTVSSRLSTAGYTAPDNTNIGNLATRLTAIRAGLLDNLDVAVSTRSDYAGGDTAGTTTLLARLSTGRASALDNLDATISSRSTYAGGDTAGTTTLLSRLTSGRASALDYLDGNITNVPLAVWNILISNTFSVGSLGEKFKLFMAALGTDNRVKVSADVHSSGETVAAVSGHTPQTGDAYARIGANGAGLTALGDTRITNLDATVSSRSTYAGADTAGTTTLLSRLSPTRAGYLDNLTNLDTTVSSRNATTPPTAAAIRTEIDTNSTKLDATVSSRLSSAGYTAPDNAGIATLGTRLSATRAGYLDNLTNLDTTVSSRSTYAGTDTAGVTTLLSRLSSARALLLDNIDVAVSSRSTYAGGDTAGTTTLLSRIGSALTITSGKVDINDKTGFELTSDERDAIAAVVEAAIGSADLTEGGIAAAVRSEIAAELALIDAAISSRSVPSDTSDAILSFATSILDSYTDLQTSVETRLAAVDFIAPDNAGIDALELDVTTLLDRITEQRAINLDNLDDTITSRLGDYDGQVLQILSAIDSTMEENAPDSGEYRFTIDALSNSPVTSPSDIRTELATELARIDANISSRSTYAGTDTSGTTTLLTRIPSALNISSGKVDINDKTGFELSVQGKIDVATAVEEQIIDEADGNAILEAITDKIASVNPSLGDLTLGAIAVANRTEMDSNSTKLANLDTTVSSRSTYAGADTAGITTLLSRLTSIRAGLMDNLPNLDATVSSRLPTSSYTAPDNSGITTLLTRLSSIRAGLLDNLNNLDVQISAIDFPDVPTVAEIRTELDSNSTKLANLDAAVSTRSTYAGADTAGTTTLLGRFTSGRATLLDNLSNLDTTVSSRSTYNGADTTGTITLLSRLSSTRADLMDNIAYLDDYISAVQTSIAGISFPDVPTVIEIREEIDTNSTQLVDILSAIGGIESGDAPTVEEIRAEIDTNSTRLQSIETAIGGIESGDAPTVEEIRMEIDNNSTKLASIEDSIQAIDTGTAPTAAEIREEIDTNSTKLDVAVSTRLATGAYTAPDNSGIATLGTRLTSQRALNLDNLDTTVSSRNSVTPPTVVQVRQEMDSNSTKLANLDTTVSSRNATTPPTVAAIRTELDTNSTKLANLDTTVSSRSTYSGGDTAGTTTLLSRISSVRAGNLDNLTRLDVNVSTRNATAPPTAAQIRAEIDANSTKLVNLDVAVSSRLATSGYTAPDNAGITTLLERLTSTRAGLIDNLDAAISTRLASVAYTAPNNSDITLLLARLTVGRANLLDNLSRLDIAISSIEFDGDFPSAVEIRTELDSNSTKLANLDAPISSRSVYAGSDTAGTTTLLSRLTSTRAGLIDNLDAAITSRLAAAGYSAPNNAGIAELLNRVSESRADLFDNLAGLDAAILQIDSVNTQVESNTTAINSVATGVGTLLTRLSAARADYLDTLNGLVGSIWSNVSDSTGVTTLLARFTSQRAANLDNLDMKISDIAPAEGGDGAATVAAIVAGVSNSLRGGGNIVFNPKIVTGSDAQSGVLIVVKEGETVVSAGSTDGTGRVRFSNEGAYGFLLTPEKEYTMTISSIKHIPIIGLPISMSALTPTIQISENEIEPSLNPLKTVVLVDTLPLGISPNTSFEFTAVKPNDPDFHPVLDGKIVTGVFIKNTLYNNETSKAVEIYPSSVLQDAGFSGEYDFTWYVAGSGEREIKRLLIPDEGGRVADWLND